MKAEKEAAKKPKTVRRVVKKVKKGKKGADTEEEL